MNLTTNKKWTSEKTKLFVFFTLATVFYMAFMLLGYKLPFKYEFAKTLVPFVAYMFGMIYFALIMRHLKEKTFFSCFENWFILGVIAFCLISIFKSVFTVFILSFVIIALMLYVIKNLEKQV